MATAITALLIALAAVAAWGGLAWMIVTVPPTKPFALVVVYLFAFTGITSTAALGTWALLRPRAPQGRLESPAGYVGHAVLLALIALFALWLQSLRMLTLTVALLLAGLYTLLELALLFGTRGAVELELSSHASGADES